MGGRASVLYENICGVCNPGAEKKGNLEDVKTDVPTLYVGEISRTIYERSREHWADWRRKNNTSHILKHQEQVHKGAEEPRFVMKVVRSFKTALSMQVGEAVRIRRRGGDGNILNSKAEYNRSRIPRLIVDQQADKDIKQMEEEELWKRREQLEEELREWSQIKYYAREQELREKKRQLSRIEGRIKAYKREQEGAQGPKEGKRRKLIHAKIEEDWGEMSKGHHQSSQPSNQADSVSEIILVRAPPGLPLLAPSPHRGSRCGVGLAGGGLGRGALPHHLQHHLRPKKQLLKGRLKRRGLKRKN